jgi:O-antigen/teichoic acid export membrane protein
MIANYASRLWSGFSTFAFIPIYLNLLGEEAFGLITFGMTLLSVAFILDMGISSAFAREMARDDCKLRIANLLRSLETVYLSLVLLIVILAVPLSYFITFYWLNAPTLDPTLIQRCVVWMVISSIVQVMMALYVGGLMGANRHVAVAGFQIGFSVVRSGLVIIPLILFRSIEFFFVWQLAASLIFVFLIRKVVWRMLYNATSRPIFSITSLRAIQNFAGGMLGITIISSINTHSDKIVVSKVFSLIDFGSYSVASLIGQIPSMLALPIAVTMLPRLTRHFSRNEFDELISIFMRYSMIISLVAFVSAGAIILIASEILTIILSAKPSTDLISATQLLTLGGALLAVQFMPYHLAIACGHTRTNLIIGGAMAAVMPFAIWFGASNFGLIGVAWPWLLINAVAAVVLGRIIIGRFLGPHFLRWIFKANFIQAVAAAIAIFSSSLLIDFFTKNVFLRAGIVGATCIAFSILMIRYMEFISNSVKLQAIRIFFGKKPS